MKKSKKKKVRILSLDTIFNFPKTAKAQPSQRRKKTVEPTKPVTELSPGDNLVKTILHNEKGQNPPKSGLVNSSKQKSTLVSTDEIEELEEKEMFTNGNKIEVKSSFSQVGVQTDEEIVCSLCGAFISPTEVIEEGCIYCHDQPVTE